VRQQNISRLYRRHQLDSYLGPVSGPVLAQSIVPVQGDHPHRDAGVGAGDAPVVV
jgi:hypothetical protein